MFEYTSDTASRRAIRTAHAERARAFRNPWAFLFGSAR
jgi:hypothetical protein